MIDLKGCCHGIQFCENKKHLKNVGPIRHNEPPHAHSPDVASGTVARRLRIDVHAADDGSVPYFPICQGTLPWQPNTVGWNEKVIKEDWYHLHSLHWRLKTNCNITNHYLYVHIMRGNDEATSNVNLVGFWPVPPEFNCLQQASISDQISMSAFARWQNGYVLLLPARGRHCGAERAIR